MPSSSKSQAKSPLNHGNSSEEWTAAHEALKNDAELWSRLQLRGMQWGAGGELWETRHCPSCGSSISKQSSLPEMLSVLADAAGVQSRSLEMLGLGCKKFSDLGGARMPPSEP